MAHIGTRRLGDDTRNICVGVDLGKLQDHTAIVVSEGQLRRSSEEHVIARSIERKRLGTNYKAIAERLAAIDANLKQMISDENDYRDLRRLSGHLLPRLGRPTFYVDVTGLGGPFCDFLMAESPELRLIAVSITSGDRVSEWNSRGKYSVIHVGKSALVSRLQLLLGTHRIHLPQTREAELLVEELKVFQISVNQRTAFGSYGAASGSHDDLVIAAALAAWKTCAVRNHSARSIRYI